MSNTDLSDSALFKTIITIWTDFETTDLDLQALADLDAEDSVFVADISSVLVENPESDPQWVDTDFFDEAGDDEEGEEDELDLISMYEEASGNSIVDDIVIIDDKGKYIGLFTADMAMTYLGLDE